MYEMAGALVALMVGQPIIGAILIIIWLLPYHEDEQEKETKRLIKSLEEIIPVDGGIVV